MKYDIAVIGGGVCGGLILREAVKHKLSAVLIERESDVCMGQSKANSGIVHAGYDAISGTLKAKFNVRGNTLMPTVTSQLGVKFVNNGSLVVAFSDEDVATLRELIKRGEVNGVKDLEIIEKDALIDLEPHISKNALGALYAKTGGIVCPYELTIAAIGNAMDNGADLMTGFDTDCIEGDFGDYTLYAKDGRRVNAKAVINCAGAGAERVANLIGDTSFRIGFRKGEYYHGMHHITTSGKTESDIVATVKNALGSLDKIFRSLLHGNTTQIGNNLLVRILVRLYVLNLIRKRIYSIMHSHTLPGILMILIDYRLTGKFTHTHDTVCMVHTILLDAVNRWVYLSARTIKVCCMNMYAQGLSANHLGMYTCWICQPVMSMNHIKLFTTGQYTGND